MQGERIEPSKRTGMGAITYHGGVTFRVWAPFAGAVSVTGDFNGWSADATPLAAEGNGYWSVDVDGAGDGDGYKFVVRNGDREMKRNDPYARAVTNSAG